MTPPLDPFDPDEWGDRPGCEAFELAVDMRRTGALSAEASSILAAHLDSCASCQEHEATAGRLDAVFKATRPAAPSGADWQKLHEKLAGGLTRARRVPWVLIGVGFGAMALMTALDLWFEKKLPPAKLLIGPLAFYLVVIGVASVARVRRLRRLLDEHDVLAAYRSALERSLRTCGRLKWYFRFGFVVQGLRTLAAYGQFENGESRGETGLVIGCLALVGLAIALIDTRRTIRKAKRELAEMH